jgi:hypothetical protein
LHFAPPPTNLERYPQTSQMPSEIKIDLFKPQQPRIPGVADHKPEISPLPAQLPQPNLPAPGLVWLKALVPLMWLLLALAGIVTIGAGMLLWGRKAANKTVTAAETIELTPSGSPAPPPKSADSLSVGPGPIATTQELAKAWSSKPFLFHNPVTNDLIPALVVRLPGGPLWAFSMREPYGNCALEFVTDLQKLQANYRVHSNHPMVVDTCNGTVFDLSTYGNGPNGLVRGEIVAGAAVRPPLAIEVQTRGTQILAVRTE